MNTICFLNPVESEPPWWEDPEYLKHLAQWSFKVRSMMEEKTIQRHVIPPYYESPLYISMLEEEKKLEKYLDSLDPRNQVETPKHPIYYDKPTR